MLRRMPARRPEVEAGLARGRRLVAELSRELDDGIRAAGLSYASVGRAVGLSGDQVARFARGDVRRVDLVRLAALFATVGLDLTARAYPAGDALRDRPQLAVLERFRRRIHPTVRFRYEVPVVDQTVLGSGPVDRRAWDAVIEVGGSAVAIEAESKVRDLQELLRRLALKRRDGDVDRLVLVLNETAHHRRVVEAAAEPLRAQFPGSPRGAMRALRRGTVPAADTIVLL
jgi:hypothetical protein